ncbi:hypothetical protein Fot_17196 [Forsythia ovata]|uniref:Uncharacterized protein n=1 Tax=Forsythia ovata TaxID=205694 RepID=A0ABD1VHA9_9LAMI
MLLCRSKAKLAINLLQVGNSCINKFLSTVLVHKYEETNDARVMSTRDAAEVILIVSNLGSYAPGNMVVRFETQLQPPRLKPDLTAPPTPPPHQLQPPRSSFSCDRHPDEQFIGFFPSCLCECLTTLDQSFSSCRPSIPGAAAAIKSLFSSSFKATTTNNNYNFLPLLSCLSYLAITIFELLDFSAPESERLRHKCCEVIMGPIFNHVKVNHEDQWFGSSA